MAKNDLREHQVTDAPIPEVMRPMSERYGPKAVTTAAIFTIADAQNNRTIDFESGGRVTLHDEFRGEVHSIDITVMWNFNALCKLIRGERIFGTAKKTLCREKA